MTAYYVTVRVYAPYPIESNHTIKATSPATAASRAIREALNLKKDGVPVIKRRRIESWSISIKKLAI